MRCKMWWVAIRGFPPGFGSAASGGYGVSGRSDLTEQKNPRTHNMNGRAFRSARNVRGSGVSGTVGRAGRGCRSARPRARAPPLALLAAGAHSDFRNSVRQGGYSPFFACFEEFFMLRIVRRVLFPFVFPLVLACAGCGAPEGEAPLPSAHRQESGTDPLLIAFEPAP